MHLFMRASLAAPPYREREGKRRSLAQRRLQPDSAAMHLHDVPGNREPKTGTAVALGDGIIRLLELLE